MNVNQSELTSALLDGELGHDAQQRAVSAILESAPEELERLGRFRLIGDVMRGESTVLASAVVDRVREALRDEPAILAPRRRPPRWLRPVAGLAVAASVAAAAVVVAPQLLKQTGDGTASNQVAAVMQRPSIGPTLVATAPAGRNVEAVAGDGETLWNGLDERLEDRLSRLVIEHHEFGGRTGVNGPVPHIGFVSYGAR